jgi:glycosyltransferase involved in cell wall biosynthesis
VLVEALHCGLPVVATDCPYGPREILGSQGEWGRLVPRGDAAAMTSALRAALAAPHDPQPQRARAAEFSPERAIEAYWQAMFPA